MPRSASRKSSASSNKEKNTRVEINSRVSGIDNRRNISNNGKEFQKPSDCWDINNQFKGKRGCKEIQKYHNMNRECYDFDQYIEDKTHHRYRKTALGKQFYQIFTPPSSGLVWEISPLQHKFGYIDILKTNMNKEEIEILSGFKILKIETEKLKHDLKSDLKKTKERIKKKKGMSIYEKEHLIKKYSKENSVPRNYEDWPDIFKLIRNDDSSNQKKRKKEKLRECLNRRITFMRDCVYDCGKINTEWIEGHVDFIVKLQILAATHNA